MRCIVAVLILISTLLPLHAETLDDVLLGKRQEKERLAKRVRSAITRIQQTPESRGGDYLRLLPSVSVSRSAPTNEFDQAETYVSGTINVNSIFNINDDAKRRQTLKRAGEQKVKKFNLQITSLINKKYILLKKIWQKEQIYKSLSNPLDIAKFDDAIDELKIRVEEIDMQIENLYAEIELVVIEIEG